MKKIFLYVFLVLFLNSSNAFSDAINDYIFTNLQHDYTNCYCYYKISEEGVKRTKTSLKDEAVEKLAEAAERSLMGAFKVGEALNMKQEAMTARVKLSLESMKKEVDEDYVNISILIDKYGYMCRDLINDPKSRVDYWRQKYSE